MASSNAHPLILRCNSSSSSSSSQTPVTIVDEFQQDKTKIKLEDRSSVSSGLKIEIPSSTGEFKAAVGHGEDDPKTPTSTEHRIPVMAACPLAPKKTRCRKRKVQPFFPVFRVPAADFIAYVDAMFDLNHEAVYIPDIMVGDLGAGDRAKRLVKVIAVTGAHEP